MLGGKGYSEWLVGVFVPFSAVSRAMAARALLLVWGKKRVLTCCESGQLGNSPAQVYLSVK